MEPDTKCPVEYRPPHEATEERVDTDGNAARRGQHLYNSRTGAKKGVTHSLSKNKPTRTQPPPCPPSTHSTTKKWCNTGQRRKIFRASPSAPPTPSLRGLRTASIFRPMNQPQAWRYNNHKTTINTTVPVAISTSRSPLETSNPNKAPKKIVTYNSSSINSSRRTFCQWHLKVTLALGASDHWARTHMLPLRALGGLGASASSLSSDAARLGDAVPPSFFEPSFLSLPSAHSPARRTGAAVRHTATHKKRRK